MSPSPSTPAVAPVRRIALLIGIAASALAAILIAGFLFAELANSGFWLLPGFGLLGIIIFAQSFPWFLLIVILLLLCALLFLLHCCFASFHRCSSLRIGLLLFILTLACGALLSRTAILRGWQPPPPPTSGFPKDPLLRGYGAWRFHNIFQGVVREVGERTYTIQNPDGFSFTIESGPGTRFPTGKEIVVGDTILIIGEPRGESIRAFGIRKL
ncbi:MAG: hypothetical protein PHI23_04460 [Candidatus Peribacteraceae bacterium]|nr:hypothetical protein [Candidatus Peribacteraceae bacterium]